MTEPATPDREAVLTALDSVLDPRSGQGLVAAGLVQALSVRAGRAGFMLEVAPSDAELYAAVRVAAVAVSTTCARSTPGTRRSAASAASRTAA